MKLGEVEQFQSYRTHRGTGKCPSRMAWTVRTCWKWPAIAVAVVFLTNIALADDIELTNGKRIKGKVVRKEPDSVTVRLTFESGGTEIKIPTKNIRNLIIERESATTSAAPVQQPPRLTPTPPPSAIAAPTPAPAVVTKPTPTPRPAAPVPTPPPPATPPATVQASAGSLTRAEVDALIAEAGSTPPDWWDAVPLNYPKTLNLTWAKPAKGEWNNQKILGQYVWDVINPNPPRWKEGVRLLHYVLTVNQQDPEKVYQTAEALARMYHNLLQDWARAAFWWRKAAQLGGYNIDDFALELGECYWKLGGKDMAKQTLSALREDETRDGLLIKLWADMGDYDKALRLAEDKARAGMPESAYLAAGDACRLAGRHNEALTYYQKVLAIRFNPKDQFAGFIKRCQDRARASVEAVKVFDALDLSRIPDGIYKSVCPAYAGPLHVEVAVKGGRIQSCRVTQHQEKQYYSSIANTTRQIIEKQSVKGVDMTSGATITAEAIVNATAKALAGGMK